MPRRLRPALAGAVYHVTTRGVARCADGAFRPRTAGGGEPTIERCLVYTDDVDRVRFLEVLATTVLRRGWLCHAYCLMGTHYHLLIETPDPDVSGGLQYLNGCYAQWFNRAHDRAGHLFGARFHCELVETDPHLLEVSRYIVRNPVRAGLCAHPLEWRWSSYAATVGARPQPVFLSVNRLLAMFAADRRLARDRYRLWVAAAADARIAA